MFSKYDLQPTPKRLECPMCGSSQHLLGQVLGSSDWLDYTKYYNKDLGLWRSGRVSTYQHCLYCCCTECLVFGDESLFNPNKKPSRLYHDRKGFYVKQELPQAMIEAVYSRVELKCYVREDNSAGLNFIGMLKITQVKSIAELPKFLACGVDKVVEFAKVRLEQLKKKEKK